MNEKNISLSNNNITLENNNETNSNYIILLSVLYGSMSFICITGNSLILFFVIKRKRFKFVINYFICNLAIADIIIGVFVSPFQVN